MNFEYISPAAYAEFVRKYPSAESFLLHASLEGEYKALKSELKNAVSILPSRKQWIEQRLLDLEWAGIHD